MNGLFCLLALVILPMLIVLAASLDANDVDLDPAAGVEPRTDTEPRADVALLPPSASRGHTAVRRGAHPTH